MMQQFDQQFNGTIIGVDEAGRGPLAGAVVAAAVYIPCSIKIDNLRDSKKLSASMRQQIYAVIANSCTFGVGIASVQEIDQLNILQASLLAMRRAITICTANLNPQDSRTILVDGNCNPLPNTANVHPIIKGDDKSAAIAAASVVAKVTRDRMMCELHQHFPYYDWQQNQGYPTKKHKQSIATYGLSPHHRRSFNCK